MPPKKQPSVLDRMNKHPSESRLQLSRTLGYSAAGASFLLVLTFVQLGPKSDWRLEWGLLMATVAMGGWLALAGMYEGAIMLGRSGHGFMKTQDAEGWTGGTGAFAGLLLVGSLGLLLHWALPLAAWALGISIVFYFLFTIGFSQAYDTWFRNKGEAAQEPPEA